MTQEETTCKCIEFHPQIKKSFIELALYTLFFSTTCIVAFGNVGSSLYFCTDMISKTFAEKTFQSDANPGNELSFLKISSIKEFWQFTGSVLVDGVYGSNIPQYDNQVGSIQYTRFMTENILMGSVRIRQLRVKRDTCDVHPLFTHLFKDCFDYFSKSSEDRNSFGPKNGSAWNYHSQEELEGFSTWGKFQFYPGGGFYQDLDGTLENAAQTLRDLSDNGWINRGTRVVFIEFSIYNPNINVFCSTKLIVEVLPTGGLVPTTHFRALKLLKFNKLADFILIAFEAAFVIQILAYSWMEIRQMIKLRQHYFYDLWNLLDLLIILIAYITIGFSIFLGHFIDHKIEQFKNNTTKYVSFDVISFWQRFFLDAMGVCVGLVWIRMLKYVKFSSTMLQFGKTLERCAKDIAGFGLMFFIVFVAYAQLGFILFGSEIKDFHTFYDSIFTLMRTILGDFDYLAIEKANRVLGPIYFLSYVFFVFFVLLNMFLAIINDTYEKVKSEGSQEVLPLGEYVKEKLRCWLKRAKAKVESRKWSEDERPAADNLEPEIFSTKKKLNVFNGAGDRTGKCKSSISNNEKLERMNERIFALENSLDNCVIKFNEVVNKLR